MKPKAYSFISTWKLETGSDRVGEAIHDSLQWPTWWKSITDAEELEKGDERGIGSVRRYTIQSPLLYALKFNLTVTGVVEQSFIKGTVSGELEGNGDWNFIEDAGITTALCHWRVATTVPWMNRAAFVLRPLFRFNHSLVMRNGAKSLARKLNARLVSCSSISMK